jgi:hypothetical protein
MCTWSRERGSILLTLVCFAALGCGEGKPKVTIQPAEQLPIREFTIDGMPDELEAVTLVYSPAEEEWADLYFEEQIERDEAGNFVAFVPVHPAGVAQGGTLDLEIEGLDHRPLELTVKPVPPAPGTTREFVAGVARVSQSLIESWGTSVEEVLGILEENSAMLPVQLLVPAIAYSLLDGTEAEPSLLRLVDDMAEFEGELLDGADRLLAVTTLPAALETIEVAAKRLTESPVRWQASEAGSAAESKEAALQSPRKPTGLAREGSERSEGPGPAHFPIPLALTRSAHHAVRSLAADLANAQEEGISPQKEPSEDSSGLLDELEEQVDAMGTALANPVYSRVPISTVAELDRYMSRRGKLQRELSGDAGKDARKKTVTYLGMVPHLAIINVANYLLDVALESNLYLLPSRLDPLEVWAERDEFFEDDDRKSSWKAWAVAHSDSMSLDPTDVIKAIQQLSSFIKWLKGLSPPSLKDQMLAQKRNDPKWMDRLDAEVEAGFARRELAQLRARPGWRPEAFGTDSYRLDKLEKKVEGLLKKSVVKSFMDALEKGPIKQQFGPYMWGPIPTGTEAKIVEARISGSCAKMGGGDSQPYQAAEAGECGLVIETNKQAFGGVFTWGNRDLLVRAIEVEIGPQGMRIPVGSRTAFEATVRNAKDKKVRWRSESGAGAPFGENLYRWKAPEKLADGRCEQDFRIEAESMTRTGPRASGEPPRVGRTRITVEEPRQLEIVPEEVVLAPGEKFEFGYQAEGSPEVSWSAETPGKINSRSGQYTAPKEAGNYVVQASLEGTDGGSCAEDEALVRVAGCSWMVMFDGKPFVSKKGDEAGFVSMPGPAGFSISLSQKDGGFVGVGLTPTEGAGAWGNMGASVYETYGSFEKYKEPKPPMAVTLDRSGSGVVSGRAFGTVRVINPVTEQERLAPFSAEFMIAGDPDAPSGSPMDYLGNMGRRLGQMPMVPEGMIGEEQQEQLQDALRDASSPEGLQGLQDGKAMLGGLTTLSCEVK